MTTHCTTRCKKDSNHYGKRQSSRHWLEHLVDSVLLVVILVVLVTL